VALAVALAVASAAGCREVGTDPKTPLSIAFDTLAAPAVALGDVLRDTTGAPAALRAQAYNSKDQVIPDAPIQFIALDRGIEVSADGLLTGDSVRSAARVLAAVGGLQSTIQVVSVTYPPDTMSRVRTEPDSLRYSVANAANVSDSLAVRVTHLPDTAVVGWVVRYSITQPAVSATDTTIYLVADQAGSRRARADTTDASGIATLFVRLSPRGREAVRAAGDSVVVQAFATYKQPLAGSPMTFVVRVTDKSTP
jgi:hypothetical protein